MCSIKVINFIFLTILHVCNGSRRIVNGDQVRAYKKYMVYLLKADIDAQTYDAWLCGGALVSSTFIITSAACVEDVKHLYAIAGYDQYVEPGEMSNNECIKKTRKKIIYSCVPKSYELDYERFDKWAFIDIALVKVESPYIPNDPAFAVCTYAPEWIPINYEKKYQEPGTDAIALGWGHTTLWRKPADTQNYNQKFLRYGSTMIQEKQECKTHYAGFMNMSSVIDNYMICTFNRGNIDDKGELTIQSAKNVDGCTSRRNKGNDAGNDYNDNKTKLLQRAKYDDEEVDENGCHTVMRQDNGQNSDSPGICQNDHGGPLVTWVGAHEVLIGVASVFKVDSDQNCMGPYLFTSTQCNGAFISCILESNNYIQRHSRTGKYRRELCDSAPALRGYDTVERHISWMDHPDGPAVNEVLTFRPMRPLRSL